MDSKRLVLEERAMRERWGDTTKLHYLPNGLLAWKVTLHQEGNQLLICIVYPEDYPFSPPEIICETPLPADTPHLLEGNRLCWRSHGTDRRARNRWNPSHDTAAMCVGVAQRWFLCFLVWSSTGVWPTSRRNK